MTVAEIAACRKRGPTPTSSRHHWQAGLPGQRLHHLAFFQDDWKAKSVPTSFSAACAGSRDHIAWNRTVARAPPLLNAWTGIRTRRRPRRAARRLWLLRRPTAAFSAWSRQVGPTVPQVQTRHQLLHLLQRHTAQAGSDQCWIHQPSDQQLYLHHHSPYNEQLGVAWSASSPRALR